MKHWVATLSAIGLLSCGGNTPSTPPEPSAPPASNTPRTPAPTPSTPNLPTPSEAPPTGSSSAYLSQPFLRELTEALAMDTLEGRDEGTDASSEARALIIQELQRCGVAPGNGESFEQRITTGAGTNILGEIRGTDPVLRDRYLIISAHYDHLGADGEAIYNGANDNAAGVAVMIGMACQLAETPLRRSVLIGGWDAEEPPTFLTDMMGSEFYAANPVVPLENTEAVVVMDLIGADLWPGYNGHLVLGAETSPEIEAALKTTNAQGNLEAMRIGEYVVGQSWSDYDGFKRRGVPFAFFTNGQNAEYHTENDVPSSLNYPKMELQARYMADMVDALDSNPAKPQFMPERRTHLNDLRTVERIVESALADGGLTDQLGFGGSLFIRGLRRDLDDTREWITRIEGGGSSEGVEEFLQGIAINVMCLARARNSPALCLFI